MFRSILVLILCCSLVAGVTYGVVSVVLRPETPPQTSYVAPVVERLADRLLFVVVDGLRYDIATDPELMPRFSEAMRRHSSAEIWSGRVSMTTSAILSYGTGQRGQLEQVVRNLTPDAPPFNSWLDNARKGGLTLMVVGDPAWTEMYGPAFSASRPDPKGVAIDQDFNAQTFRDTRELLGKRPDVLIAHFVTPDHQGHAHGIHSEKYRAHIHNFDVLLSDLLGEAPSDWTVIVTSDHGAADSGTHGADVPIQRRSPIYAYGRGIAKDVHPTAALDQIDLANTLAALLGVAMPRESRGLVLTSWLDMSDSKRAALACEDAKRSYAYGSARLGDAIVGKARADLTRCEKPTGHRERVNAARRVSTLVDREISASSGLSSAKSMWLLGFSCLLSVVIAFIAAGQRILKPLAPLLVTLCAATWLVYHVERLPGHGPNIARVALFIACNLIALFTLLRPLRAAKWAEQTNWLVPALLPGMLVASYPANTQPEAFVAVVVIGIVFCILGPIGSPLRRSDGWIRLRAGQSALTWPRLGFVLVAALVLVPAGTRPERHFPAWLTQGDVWPLVAALAMIALYGISARIDRLGREGTRGWWLWVGLLVVACSLILRRYVPYQVGRSCILVFPLVAVGLVLVGRFRLATLAGLAGFAWVSRDREWLAMVASLMLAEAAGDGWRSRRDEARDSEPLGTRHEVRRHAPGFYDLVLGTCFVFGLLFVQRLGIQGHIDFGGMDLAAGAFNDDNVPLWVVSTALSWKYILAEMLVVVAFLGRLDPSSRSALLPALVITYATRTVALLMLLFFCGGSFWTALRVLSDLPFALTGLLAVALSWLGVSLWQQRQARDLERRSSHSVA